MSNRYDYCVLFLAISLRLFSLDSAAALVADQKHLSDEHIDHNKQNGTKWAVLVAGSREYINYRHQADVCHAYQILKKGGLKDENIIVFMYDDIAFNRYNPRPGIIINKPDGPDVYRGVPKDYTRKHVTAGNFYAAILGNRSALRGGSGKVLESGPNDHIFIYYADHGAPGVLEMPSGEDRVFAKDFVDVLKKKHEAKGYKSMVIYIEACESGSMFEGLLPKNINIYATTAANGKESSYGTYCPGDFYSSPPEYDTCLGDMYSISWMEECDKIDLRQETLGHQYEEVRRRTANSNLFSSSHVMQFGNMNQKDDSLSAYLGSNPANDNFTSNINHDDHDDQSDFSPSVQSTVVNQRDADILYFWRKFQKASTGSAKKLEAHKKLQEELSERKQIDHTIHQIGKFLFGTYEETSRVFNNVRPTGQPLVDDWDCFKMHMKTYEKYCGRLSKYGMKYTKYGMKYTRAIANMCNAGITTDQLVAALMPTCAT